MTPGSGKSEAGYGPSTSRQAGELVRARRDFILLEAFPEPVPTTLAEAYAIQDAAIGLWAAEPPVGWKLGMIGPPASARRPKRFVGPFWSIHPAGSTLCAPLGQLFAEVELIVKIDLSEGIVTRPLRISEIRMGIELAGSGVSRLARYGPAALAADFGNNVAMVIGPRLRPSAITDARAVMQIDGVTVGTGGSSLVEGGVVDAVSEAVDILAGRGIPITAETWLATGALTGAHPVYMGQTITATIDDAVVLACSVAERPRHSHGSN
jgi:2-keto-4-pentenoate hydratase